MATIYALPNAADWEQKPNENFDDYFKRQEVLYKALDKSRIMTFGHADGQAVYYVHSWKPFVVCHVPYMDKWRKDEATERGITVAYAKKACARNANFVSIFA